MDIPLVIAAYFIWKSVKRTKIVALIDIPLREALDEYRNHPETPESKTVGWRRVTAFLWE